MKSSFFGKVGRVVKRAIPARFGRKPLVPTKLPKLFEMSRDQVIKFVEQSANTPDRLHLLNKIKLNANQLKRRGVNVGKFIESGFSLAEAKEIGYNPGDFIAFYGTLDAVKHEKIFSPDEIARYEQKISSQKSEKSKNINLEVIRINKGSAEANYKSGASLKEFMKLNGAEKVFWRARSGKNLVEPVMDKRRVERRAVQRKYVFDVPSLLKAGYSVREINEAFNEIKKEMGR
jgi:hypothetical protein